MPRGATFHLSVSDQPIRAGGARDASDYIGRRAKHQARDGDSMAGGLVASGLVGWPGGRDGDAARAMWAAAEAAEQPKRARPDLAAKRAAAGATPRERVIGRRLIVALPACLDDAARARLLNGYALHLRDQLGVGVEWAHHRGDRASLNDHGHLNITARTLDAAGVFGTKTRAFSLDGREQGRGGRSAETVSGLRQEWERRVNAALERAGQTVRVDSRSLRQAALEDATAPARRPRPRVPPAAYARAQDALARQAGTATPKPPRRPYDDPRSGHERRRIKPPYINAQRDRTAIAQLAARDAATKAATIEQDLRQRAQIEVQRIARLQAEVDLWQHLRALAQRTAQHVRQAVRNGLERL